VGAAVLAVRPPAEPTQDVVVAARDLSSGHLLQPEDLRVSRYPPDLVPPGSVSTVAALLGSPVALPLADGDVLTDRRVLSNGLLSREGDEVVVPVLVPAEQVPLVRPGDLIDVVAAVPFGISVAATEPGAPAAGTWSDLPGPPADPVPSRAGQALRVLASIPPDGGSAMGTLVVAARYGASADLAAASMAGGLTVVIHPS
jgi:pilus assembly protein CpaB